MSNRLIRKSEAIFRDWPKVSSPEVWVVLSVDLRDELFEGTFLECQRYLKNVCATGNCED